MKNIQLNGFGAGLGLSMLLAVMIQNTACSNDASPPNILFAIADDWGFGHASAYGCKWTKTPAFDKVASEGLLFQRAYTPNAKCAPSRACILTGRNSWQLKEAANHLCYFPSEFRGWPEVLSSHGWHMGHTAKGWGPGVAVDINGKPRQMTGKAFNARTAKPPTTGIGNNDYAANFDDFLDTAPNGAPWCFWYGAIEPHRAYEFGSGVNKGGKSLQDIERVPSYWPDNETVRNDMLDYAVEIEHFDAHLGRMLDSLGRRGLLDNTLIIVTSDHGMPFPRGKGGAYEASNHVPMAMMWKNGIESPGRKIDDFVSFIDLAPTIIEVAGLNWEMTKMAATSGVSLTDIFRSASVNANPARDHVLIGMERHDIGRPNDVGYPIRGIVTRDALYLHNFEPDRWPACNPETGYLNCDAGATKTSILNARRLAGASMHWSLCFGKRPEEELFDLVSDPDCVNNIALLDSSTSRLKMLREKMEDQLRKQEDPRMFGNGKIFDEYPHSNPNNRGFYERFMRGERINANWVLDSDFETTPIER
jgi:N-sulfoglucosamine sulfohydrolase